MAQHFNFIVHRDHYSAAAYYLHRTNFAYCTTPTTAHRVTFYCAAIQFYRAPRPLLRSGLFAALHNFLFYPAPLYPLMLSAPSAAPVSVASDHSLMVDSCWFICDKRALFEQVLMFPMEIQMHP
ncbi:hypothetical protein T11_473 [Trichinella zimbabwensis]|uniref:Uncharacterized protein n=1 Tax=Trichinella zimbabwensis TaxID=268475 RepID=A0A0V1I0S0_9BILA|nr:hypothetical protein T11_473 [Trichinella zimbabwensis]